MAAHFSIVREFPKSRWGASHFPNKIPAGWKDLVRTLGALWEHGDQTSLESVWFEYFDQRKFPQLPKWMQEK